MYKKIDDYDEYKKYQERKNREQFKTMCLFFFCMYMLAIVIGINPIPKNRRGPCVELPKVTRKDKIAILTMGTQVEEVLRNNQKYVKKYGYDYIDITGAYEPMLRPEPWAKFKGIIDYLDNYDYIVWLDSDAVFMNFDVSFEQIIEYAGRDHDIIISEDDNGINSGVFIVKNSNMGKWLMKEMWDQDFLVEPSRLYLPFKYEQRAFHYIYYGKEMMGRTYQNSEKIRKYFRIIPSCVFNSNVCEELFYTMFTTLKKKDCSNEYMKGDFIVHLAGKSPAIYRNYLLKQFALYH